MVGGGFLFRSKRFALLLLVCVAGLTIVPELVFACTCIPLSPEETYEISTAVFAGRVVSIEAPVEPMLSSLDPLRITFQVWRVWKGPDQSTIMIATARETMSCGYPFKEGGVYLVYAFGSEDEWSTHLCSRTQPLLGAGKDLIALGEGRVLLLLIVSGGVVGIALVVIARRRRALATQ